MTIGKNDYPGYAGQIWDPYGYAARQCASFANWRCMHDFGMPAIHNPAGNDGGKFAGTLHTLYGIPVDGMPQVQDIVSFPAYTAGTGQYGHVAVVLEVQGSQVLVEDYNWDDAGDYTHHLMPIAGARFAHVKSQPAPVPVPPSGVDMANVKGVYWPEKNQQFVIQLARDGNLWAKYWPAGANGWGNTHVNAGQPRLNPAQGVDVFFSPGGQMHIVAEGADGLMRQFYQSAAGAGATTWTAQQLP